MRNTDWMEFKKTFTQSQEDALWQYFIDHSRIQPDGSYCIAFTVKNVDDFWFRVTARHLGEFKRYNKELKEEARLKMEKHYKKLAKKQPKFFVQWEKIKAEGSWFDRLLISFSNKVRKYLANKYDSKKL